MTRWTSTASTAIRKPKGGVLEPLLGFPGGALVHFAVMMTTRLAGPATNVLPFNHGNAGEAGNAPNPAGLRDGLSVGRGLGP